MGVESKGTTLSAIDIAPSAYDKPRVEDQDVEDDLQFDLKNLLVVNPHQVDEGEMQKDQRLYLRNAAEGGIQSLMKRLFSLATEPSEVGPVAALPAKEETVLPREKPVPAPKAETRWERFAREKGITNKKRDRMVWDDDLKEFRPRHGYKRANDGVMNHAIVEVKPGADPKANPWEEARAAKKTRVQKNTSSRAKNNERAGGRPFPGIPVDLTGGKAAARAGGMSRVGGGMKRGKVNTAGALSMVQGSTASMGKFDESRKGEPGRKVQGIRRQFKPVAQSSGVESQSSLKILNSVMLGKEKKLKKDEVSRSAQASFTTYDAIEGGPGDSNKRKKGRGGAGKIKKFTKNRAK